MAASETELLLRLQTEVLEAVARGDALRDVGTILCRAVERNAPGVRCSILLVDEAMRLQTLAAPSLPQSYCAAIDGLVAAPVAGSCGTAAWRNEPVEVTDIATDPLWAEYKQLALPFGLLACWSSPVRNSAGRVVATFAFYYGEARGPTAFERQMVETCVHLCALAIEHERVRARSHRLAYYDVLTGLPNRAHFNMVLDERIAAGQPFGLILLDIDHLKLVNDSAGHAAGDALLRAVANRLGTCGADILACRLGGDEMAVLVTDCADHPALELAAQRILDATSGMVTVGSQSIAAHVTLGGALFGEDGEAADILIQNADFALYQAKQTHRGGYFGFRQDLRTAMVQRIAMVRDIDAAMAEKRILPFYQPIVRLDSGEIVGLEALARMQTSEGRIASAGEFHAAFSDPRIAYELTGQMIDHIARDIRIWLDAEIPFQHVGINVTTGDFQRGDLAERITDVFTYHKVPLRHVVLEVNESVFMGGNDQAVPWAVEELRAKGLLVALDDFGTGFASLTHLLSFPVDIIKIDRSFVERLGVDQPGEVVVSAILDIAQRLDMRVVAEGIETPRQSDILRQLGCTLGQGYLFSRPVSGRDVTQLLRNFSQRVASGTDGRAEYQLTGTLP
ncbi:putative bifunctional diguanylate cyclase/phosphodiesterase [Devosia rhizoryzae]|uniref:EAL domain-containing protein n=1 Tax=Devosia rhizoryzae TaxID=2774137 RepID=A0ABX7C4U5_9HYPH|nr:EAL domain-containing protein [Devosia rhizoryzae]QQR38279.1 EAL domain-containing protein [Devosia rhizoryzae]